MREWVWGFQRWYVYPEVENSVMVYVYLDVDDPSDRCQVYS